MTSMKPPTPPTTVNSGSISGSSSHHRTTPSKKRPSLKRSSSHRSSSQRSLPPRSPSQRSLARSSSQRSLNSQSSQRGSSHRRASMGSRSSSSRHLRRNVSFNNRVIVYPTAHINDFTDEEVAHCWYDDKENNAIIHDALNTIQSISPKKKRDRDSPTTNKTKLTTSSSDSELCIRGLECRTKRGQKRAESRRSRVVDAVLDEQNVQWLNGTTDDRQLRNKYRLYSKACHAEALLMGLEDEHEAMAIYREDQNLSKNGSVHNRTDDGDKAAKKEEPPSPKPLPANGMVFPMNRRLKHKKLHIRPKSWPKSRKNKVVPDVLSSPGARAA